MRFVWNATEIAAAYQRDQEEAKTLLRHELYQAGGSPTGAARRLGCSCPVFWYWLRRLDMTCEPQVIRNTIKKRYRLL